MSCIFRYFHRVIRNALRATDCVRLDSTNQRRDDAQAQYQLRFRSIAIHVPQMRRPAGERTYCFFYPLSGEHPAVMHVTSRVCNARTKPAHREDVRFHSPNSEADSGSRRPAEATGWIGFRVWVVDGSALSDVLYWRRCY